MKKNFVRKPGVRFIDRDGTTSTTWCFDHIIKNETYLSFQVIRADFDLMLLKNAAKSGVEVREETSVVDADITTASDSVRVTSLDLTGQKTVHRARFLVSAKLLSYSDVCPPNIARPQGRASRGTAADDRVLAALRARVALRRRAAPQ